MKYLAIALLVVLGLLQYRLWLGNGGMGEVTRLRGEIDKQKVENGLLRERNRTLSAEVQDLKKGTTAIEERARTDLGMVGQKETFFQVVTPRTPETSQKQAKPRADAGRPDEARAAH
jgi:cell division protein FtsB